jgi:UDP-N-acetylglucosamine--N-acetylmuramyl-(pentapeptide) pyrophosphoryl-undecaprenol N-acetylglucosamine transferase
MQQARLNILISGGGTGGHIFPALAIAEAIKAERPEADFLFVGAKGRMEMERVPAAGYRIEGLWISGLRRSLSIDNLSFPFKVISSVLKARKIIREFRPVLAIGVGGYASAPALWMASRMGIPTLIQEQNSFPGIANRLLAGKADLICVAYDHMERYFPAASIRLTGNPVRRKAMPDPSKRDEALMHFGFSPDRPVIFLTGGSLGARTLNQSISAGLEHLVDSGVQLLWQTGKGFEQQARDLISSTAKAGYVATAFVDRMDLAYTAADLVVSRAGAMAIAELAAAGKACILVPSPNVTEDHQTKNAQAMVNHQAAMMVRDAEAEEHLVTAMLELMKDNETRANLAQNIKALARPDADRDIARLALGLIKGKPEGQSLQSNIEAEA